MNTLIDRIAWALLFYVRLVGLTAAGIGLLGLGFWALTHHQDERHGGMLVLIASALCLLIGLPIVVAVPSLDHCRERYEATFNAPR
jgi:hypothetical protein